MKYISKERQQRITNYRYELDKVLSLYSEILLRSIVCKVLYINNSNIVIEKECYGKPYLANYATFQFNISHTKNAIVLAASNESVGVDIEKI